MTEAKADEEIAAMEAVLRTLQNFANSPLQLREQVTPGHREQRVRAALTSLLLDLRDLGSCTSGIVTPAGVVSWVEFAETEHGKQMLQAVDEGWASLKDQPNV
jgi:hypothetical protein